MNSNSHNNKFYANGGVVGQEITFDFQGDEKEGVIKEITDMGDFIVSTNDGRTVLAEERDVIKLGGMHKNEPEPERKKRFGLFEDGGKISEKGYKKGDILESESATSTFPETTYEVIEVLGFRPSNASFSSRSYRHLKLKNLLTNEVFEASEARLIPSKYAAGGELGGEPRELKGYRVNIFSSDYKSDLNLLNGKNSAILVTDGKTGDSSTVMSNEPYLKLITKERFNRTGTYMYAEPVNYGKEGDWRMFGGTFVWSSDSRFRDKVSEQPIQLHDRVEYAKGGMTEHGLEIGDEILGYTKKVNELHVKNSNNAEWHSVDLDDGKRYANGGLTNMKYKIFEGYDHFNNKPLYKVTDNEDYEGEWHSSRADAKEELDDLINTEKMATGGVFKAGGAENIKLRGWYMKNYPSDTEGADINKISSFEDLWNGIHLPMEIYVVIGVADSLIRERLFSELAKIKDVDYNYIYNKWLEDPEYSKGGVVDQKGDYMLLGRLQADCDFYLGFGNRNERRLWAGNVKDQIAEMKSIYNRLSVKPEWITMKDINRYEKEMTSKMATGGGVGEWKKSITIGRNTKAEAEKNKKLLQEYYGFSGRNFKVEKINDKYVVSYEFNLTEKMATGGGIGSNLNPRSFTLDELNNLLSDKDIYISYFMEGWSGITTTSENKFIFTSTASLAFKQWKDKTLTISDLGTIEVDKGSENFAMTIIVYEAKASKPYTIRLYSKDNISGLKEFAKSLITKMATGGKLTSAQQSKFGKVMSEFKAGELHSGSKTGPIVKKRDQAIAIALAEANASRKMSKGGKVSKFKVGDAVFGMLNYQDHGFDLADDVLDGNRYKGVIIDIEYFDDLETDYLIEFENDTTLFVPESAMGKKVFHQFDENEMATGGGVNQKIESNIISDEQNATLKEYIQHPIFENYKEIDTFSSGGGFDHTMILLSNDHIVTINWESGDVQYSYYTYKNIEEYLEDPEDDERGWDNELYRPEITEGIPNYSDLDDKTFLDTMMTNKMSTGGKTKDYTNERKELLVELIDNDIIDEEHGYYKDVQSAIASNDSEQMRAIIDELVTSELIDRDDWNYRTAKRLAKEQKATGGKMTGWKHKNKV